MNTTQKTIAFWIAVLVMAGMFNAIVRAWPLKAVDRPPLRAGKQLEYSIFPVEASVDALRVVLDNKGNEGWDLAAPVVTNGTTTALIFKREKK